MCHWVGVGFEVSMPDSDGLFVCVCMLPADQDAKLSTTAQSYACLLPAMRIMGQPSEIVSQP